MQGKIPGPLPLTCKTLLTLHSHCDVLDVAYHPLPIWWVHQYVMCEAVVDAGVTSFNVMENIFTRYCVIFFFVVPELKVAFTFNKPNCGSRDAHCCTTNGICLAHCEVDDTMLWRDLSANCVCVCVCV